MSKWAERLVNPKKIPTPVDLRKKEEAAKRASARIRAADKARGHTYESVMHPEPKPPDK